MSSKIRIKGILIASIVTLVLIVIGAIVGVVIFAEGAGEEAALALNKNSNNLIYAFLVGVSVMVIGGYIAAKFSVNSPYINSAVFGVIWLALGLLIAKYDPLWFDIASSASVLPAVLFGAYLFIIKNRKSA